MSQSNKLLNKTRILFGIAGASVVTMSLVAAAIYSVNNNSEVARANIRDNQQFMQATTEFEDDEGLYKIRYYSDWIAVEPEDADFGVYSKLEDNTDSYIENLSIKIYPDSSIQDYTNSLQAKLVNYKLESKEEQYLLGNKDVTKLEVASNYGSLNIQTTSYLLDRGGDIYAIEYVGQIGRGYDTFFDLAREMAESFEFTEPAEGQPQEAPAEEEQTEAPVEEPAQ